jgi:hypothetical protein
MSAIAGNQSKTSSVFGYFVLSYCLLVPFIGTIGLFIVLNHTNHQALVFGGAAGIYLSSLTLGLFSLSTFKKYGRAEFWGLVVGIVLSGICGLLAVGSCIICCAGLPYIC